MKNILLLVFLFSGCIGAQDQPKPVKKVEESAYPKHILKEITDKKLKVFKSTNKLFLEGIVEDADKADSVAYWAENENGKKVIALYYKNAKIKQKGPFSACPDLIEGILNPPVELHLHTQEAMGKTGIINGFMEGDFSYCENGKWKTVLIH